VIQASSLAFTHAHKDDAKGAIDAFCKLKGVGPATASALLCLYKPDMFAFMDDEIIECLYEGTRGYTVKIYLDVNQKCCELAKALNKIEKEKKKLWTPCRVGKTLWTAARIAATCATKEEDLTLVQSVDGSKTNKKSKENESKKKESTKKEYKVVTPKKTAAKKDKVVTPKATATTRKTKNVNENDENVTSTKRRRVLPPRNAKKQST